MHHCHLPKINRTLYGRNTIFTCASWAYNYMHLNDDGGGGGRVRYWISSRTIMSQSRARRTSSSPSCWTRISRVFSCNFLRVLGGTFFSPVCVSLSLQLNHADIIFWRHICAGEPIVRTRSRCIHPHLIIIVCVGRVVVVVVVARRMRRHRDRSRFNSAEKTHALSLPNKGTFACVPFVCVCLCPNNAAVLGHTVPLIHVKQHKSYIWAILLVYL